MSEEEYYLETFCQSTVYPLFPLLRKRIVHRTGIRGYRGIRKSGHIIANQGQFPYTYPQSRVYFAHSMNYISLFDLESAKIKDCISTHHTWGHFFYDHKPVTIILGLNRHKLGDDLIPNSAAPKPGTEGYKSKIPYVEVWYPRPISISVIESYIITVFDNQSRKLLFEEFTQDQFKAFDEALNLIEEASGTMNNQPERDYDSNERIQRL